MLESMKDNRRDTSAQNGKKGGRPKDPLVAERKQLQEQIKNAKNAIQKLKNHQKQNILKNLNLQMDRLFLHEISILEKAIVTKTATKTAQIET